MANLARPYTADAANPLADAFVGSLRSGNEAELSALVRSIVRDLRLRDASPEAMLIHIKRLLAGLNDAVAPANGRTLHERVIGWCIEEYYTRQ